MFSGNFCRRLSTAAVCIAFSLSACALHASDAAEESGKTQDTFGCGHVVAPSEVDVFVGENVFVTVEFVDDPQSSICQGAEIELLVPSAWTTPGLDIVHIYRNFDKKAIIELRPSTLVDSTELLTMRWFVRLCLSGTCVFGEQTEIITRVNVDAGSTRDLTVTSLKATALTDSFKNLKIQALGINQGERTFPAVIQENLRVKIGGVDYGLLDAWCFRDAWDGAGCNLDVAVQVEPGTWQIEVCADSDQSLFLEENVLNNCRTEAVTVAPLQPDLAVTGMTLSTTSPKVGESTTVTVTVRNQGNLNSPPYQLRLTTPEGDQLQELPAHGWGWSSEVNFPWIPTREGVNSLTAHVDPQALIEDHDRSNNELATTVSVLPSVTQPAKPDLQFSVSPLIVSPAAPNDSSAITLTGILHNAGPGPTPEGIEPTFHFEINGSTYSPSPCPRLGPEGSCSRTVNIGILPAGIHTVTLVADPMDLIWEGGVGESNNTHSENMTVTVDPLTLADLVIHATSIRMNPISPQVGESVTFELELWNSGAETPSGTSLEAGGSWFGPTKIHSCSPTPVPSASSCTVFEMTWHDIPAGHQSITFEADPMNRVLESNENNNQFPFQFFVGGSTGTVSCQGLWILTERTTGQVATSTGSVVDGCDVYWGANQPTGVCLQTSGSGGMTVEWIDLDSDGCPDQADVSVGLTYDISIAVP